MTTKQMQRSRLLEAHPRRLAIHEMSIVTSSQTAQSMRLREMAGEGVVVGEFRKDEQYKEWGLTGAGLALARQEKAQFAERCVSAA